MSDDSAKVLGEKLALSRELAILKPEIDHLRSQLSHQKDVLAEKLALERQLNSLEVELSNEKRATQKALQQQEGKESKAEEELRQRVAELEKELAAEQKASEKARKIQQKAQTDSEGELRQQVTDLEKKLADEKRATQKAKRSQDSDDKEAQTSLQEKIKELEGQLASEHREMDRVRKSNEKEVAAVHDQVEMLTQRVEEFKNKLRETRAELKEARAEISQARTTTTTVPIKEDEPKKPLAMTKAGKKRRANEISVDEMMLDTPGNAEGRAKRPAKKRGIDLATVGEKSTFSITPFLNKSNTISLAETIEEEVEEPSILEGKGNSAAPIIEPEDEPAEETVGPAEKQPARSLAKALKAMKPKTTAPVQKKARGRPKAGVLAESSPNRKVTTLAVRTSPQQSSKLEKVAEEPVETSTETVSVETVPAKKAKATELQGKSTTAALTGPADTSNASSDNPEPKKKKRKLLGTSAKGTLFDKDDDAGEAVAAIPTAATATAKRKPMGLKASTRKGPVASLAQKGAFPRKSFSPLKRERRGVNASFLA